MIGLDHLSAILFVQRHCRLANEIAKIKDYDEVLISVSYLLKMPAWAYQIPRINVSRTKMQHSQFNMVPQKVEKFKESVHYFCSDFQGLFNGPKVIFTHAEIASTKKKTKIE